jgi:hypothetical protein
MKKKGKNQSMMNFSKQEEGVRMEKKKNMKKKKRRRKNDRKHRVKRRIDNKQYQACKFRLRI